MKVPIKKYHTVPVIYVNSPSYRRSLDEKRIARNIVGALVIFLIAFAVFSAMLTVGYVG